MLPQQGQLPLGSWMPSHGNCGSHCDKRRQKSQGNHREVQRKERGEEETQENLDDSDLLADADAENTDSVIEGPAELSGPEKDNSGANQQNSSLNMSEANFFFN